MTPDAPWPQRILAWGHKTAATWIARAREADRELARKELESFERWHGLASEAPRAVAASTELIVARTAPDGLPLLVHHLRLTEDPSGTGLSRLAGLASHRAGRMDLVVVVWDVVSGKGELGATIEGAEAMAERAGLVGPLLVAVPGVDRSEVGASAKVATALLDPSGRTVEIWRGAVTDATVGGILGHLQQGAS